MKPFYYRITTEINEPDYLWKKAVYIFGLKIAEWEYSKKGNSNKVGFDNKK